MNTEKKSGAYAPAKTDHIKMRAVRIMSRRCTRQEKCFEDFDELVEVVEQLRSMGCIIVLTMGTWDLFHIGHADYIEMAKVETEKLYPEAEQVILVVGVDSDELTRERKGPKRPIVNEAERRDIISHLAPVDIVMFEKTLGYMHRTMPHDVRVISTSTHDLKPDEEMASYCARVINLPPQAETSTSARVRLLFIEGGQEALEKFRDGVTKLLEETRDAFEV